MAAKKRRRRKKKQVRRSGEAALVKMEGYGEGTRCGEERGPERELGVVVPRAHARGYTVGAAGY